MDFHYQPLSDRSGVMTIRTHTSRPVPISAHWGCVAVLEQLLTICGKKGTVGVPEILDPQTARFRLDW